jgi:hypothetical protein
VEENKRKSREMRPLKMSKVEEVGSHDPTEPHVR